MVYEIPDVQLAESAALERIEELRRELRFYVAEPRRWVGSVRRVLGARAIRGSNSIEGFNVSVEDALAAMEDDEPTEARAADWDAVRGYRRAMTYVLQLAQDKHFNYGPGLVRSLHFMMTEYALDSGPGLWRPGPIWIRNEASGEIVYEGPEADAVPELIDGLVAQLRIETDGPPMVRAAMAHLNLTMIHPFRDGNGRMARCLQTLVLAREQILAPEWCSIEEYLGVNTEAYYRVLADVGKGAWHPERDPRPWVRFCLEAHYIQAASVLRRVQESEQIWEAVDELRKRHGLPERSAGSLFDAAIGLRIRNASYRRDVALLGGEEISKQVATSDLRAMVKAGLLVKRGEKRGTYYLAANPLKKTREQIRADRKPIDASSIFAA